MSTFNKEHYYIIKNQLEYLRFLFPRSNHNINIIYKKYNNIIDGFTNFTNDKAEKLYCYCNNIKEIPKCVCCSNKVKFKGFILGYSLCCSYSCSNKINKKLSVETQKKEFYKIHKNKFTYYWDTYTNTTTKMKMMCNKCKTVFLRRPYNHKNENAKCTNCSNKKLSKLFALSIDETLKQFIDKHNDNYTYYWDTYTTTTRKMLIMCNKCNYKFYQTPTHHKNGCGCPNCSITFSKGEQLIESILKKNNIDYVKQHKYSDCISNITKYKLKFDFYLPRLNTCIEYDGVQHYEFVKHFHKSKRAFKLQQLRDQIKTEYCKNNNINLIRISYLEFNNIEKIISSIQ